MCSSAYSYSDNYISVSATVGLPVADVAISSKNVAFIGFQAPLSNSDLIADTTFFIQGLVHTGDSLLNYGMLKVINGQTLAAIDSFMIRKGKFYLNGIPQGQYILEADPLGNAKLYYTSTYYVNKTTIADAYRMPVNSDIGGVDIYLSLKSSTKDSKKIIADLNAFPVPSKNIVNLEFYTNESIILGCRIVDLSGRQVLFRKIDTNPSENLVNVDIHNLSPGIYFVQLFRKSVRLSGCKIVKF